MKVILSSVVVLSVVSVLADQVQVRNCKNARLIGELLKAEVGGCRKAPCRLRKNTDILVKYTFKPKQDVDELISHVYAYILRVPFPFPGFHKTPANKDIFTIDGQNATLPLKAGQEYYYKNKFPVLNFYPQLRFDVFWAIKTPNGDSVFCFTLPVRISS